MSRLTVESKTIKSLFQDPKTAFLIPDYQRPYAWDEELCQTLWEDLFTFAIPDEGAGNFNGNSEYFLGPIVTFKNYNRQMEVIDGQQRLTTLMLLLRAFYSKFRYMKDVNSKLTSENIEKCLWKTDEFGSPDKELLKIDSQVASDHEKEEFLNILRKGTIEKDQKSRYALNYKFFEGRIEEFLNKYPSYFAILPTRIMNNCILLPIEAESQDTALRIFSTLNDRGMPLFDSDIFKAQFYNYYSSIGKKDDFIKRWKTLEELCGEIFHPWQGTPMDELFTRYMYYIRAKKNITSTTTVALRKFYETDSYALLKKEKTFEDLEMLAAFWKDVSSQRDERFSSVILKRLFVLNYAPNSMWTYLVSVYFMHNYKEDGSLDETAFEKFLYKITGFIWTHVVINGNLSTLRGPVYSEMAKIVKNETVSFASNKFTLEDVQRAFENYSFSNNRTITRSMLTWWTLSDDNQPLLSLETTFDIEHIYARNRQVKENSLKEPKNLDALGNKVLLERRINISASDYRFEDKKQYYTGLTNKSGQKKEGTAIRELHELAKKNDFTEEDIKARTKAILDRFIEFLRENDLIRN